MSSDPSKLVKTNAAKLSKEYRARERTKIKESNESRKDSKRDWDRDQKEERKERRKDKTAAENAVKYLSPAAQAVFQCPGKSDAELTAMRFSYAARAEWVAFDRVGVRGTNEESKGLEGKDKQDFDLERSRKRAEIKENCKKKLNKEIYVQFLEFKQPKATVRFANNGISDDEHIGFYRWFMALPEGDRKLWPYYDVLCAELRRLVGPGLEGPAPEITEAPLLPVEQHGGSHKYQVTRRRPKTAENKETIAERSERFRKAGNYKDYIGAAAQIVWETGCDGDKDLERFPNGARAECFAYRDVKLRPLPEAGMKKSEMENRKNRRLRAKKKLVEAESAANPTIAALLQWAKGSKVHFGDLKHEDQKHFAAWFRGKEYDTELAEPINVMYPFYGLLVAEFERLEEHFPPVRRLDHAIRRRAHGEEDAQRVLEYFESETAPGVDDETREGAAQMLSHEVWASDHALHGRHDFKGKGKRPASDHDGHRSGPAPVAPMHAADVDAGKEQLTHANALGFVENKEGLQVYFYKGEKSRDWFYTTKGADEVVDVVKCNFKFDDDVAKRPRGRAYDREKRKMANFYCRKRKDGTKAFYFDCDKENKCDYRYLIGMDRTVKGW